MDNWEQLLEEGAPAPVEESKAKGKFSDEEEGSNSEDERQQKAAEELKKKDMEEKRKQAAEVNNAKKKDYEKMYDQRMNKGKKNQKVRSREDEIRAANPGITEQQLREMLSREAEEGLADNLFEPDLGTDAAGLKKEKDYVEFGRKVRDVLYEGGAPYNIPKFFGEAFQGLSKSLSSEEIKDVVNMLTVHLNEKIKEEKAKDKKKKEKKQPMVKGGKGVDKKMAEDLLGLSEEEEDYQGEEEVEDRFGFM